MTPLLISASEFAALTQESGDRERICRALQAISAHREVSVQDARDAGFTQVPKGYIERFGRYEPQTC